METGNITIENKGMLIYKGISYYRILLIIHDFFNVVPFPMDLIIKKEKNGHSIGFVQDYFKHKPKLDRKKANRKFSLDQVEKLLQERYGDDYIKDILILHINEYYPFPMTDDLAEFIYNPDVFEFYLGNKFLLNYRPSTYPSYYAETQQLFRIKKINKIKERLMP